MLSPTLHQSQGAHATGYWLIRVTSSLVSEGPSAYCLSEAQQATIYDWQLKTLMTTLRLDLKASKDKQINLSELNYFER